MSPLAPRPGILDIDPYVPGRSKLPGRDRVIKLSSNEGAFGPSPRAIAAYRAAAETMHRYPDGGAVALREALGRRFGLDPDRIVCGAGSDEHLINLARAYAGPGDEVLHSFHGFNLYPIIARSVGATPIAAPEIALTADVDALLAAASARTRIVYLANPNNPTGTYLPINEVRRLRAGLDPGVLLVLDGAYAEYVTRNDYAPGIELVDAGDNVVMTRTFSKIFAMGGMRLGWCYCPPAIADALNRIRSPFSVASATMAAAIAAIEDVDFIAASRDHNAVWLPWLSDRLRALGLEVPVSVANFVLVRFPADPAKNATAAMRFLNARGIIPRNTDSYHLPDCLRITIGREDEMRAVAAALAEFMGAPS
ncbi:MAG: histidinol-phosphate transaminase [Alphaproteobacteria bacterium]|nr:histidinol-phosphate transaminase [Alphaproteobacteria bacterium]